MLQEQEVLDLYARARARAAKRGVHYPIRTHRHLDEERGVILADDDRVLARYQLNPGGRVSLRLAG